MEEDSKTDQEKTFVVRRQSTPFGWIVTVAAVFIIVAGLKAASEIVTQILLVLFLSIVLSPLYYFLRKRIPSWLALAIIIGGMVLLCFTGIIQLSKALIQFSKSIPDYHSALVERAEDFGDLFREQGVDLPDNLFADALSIDKKNIQSFAQQAGTLAVNLLQHIVIVLVIVSFVLCELVSLPDKIRRHPRVTPEIWERGMRIVLDVRHYMGIKTIVSAVTGLLIYGGLVLLKVDSALILAFTAFVLNFIPVFGSIVAAIPAVAIALVNFDLAHTLYVLLLYLFVNQLIGNILEPKFMGYGFGVSPVVVLFSVIFWGWVLGPVGTLFAVPLTMALKSSYDIMLYDEEAKTDASGNENPHERGKDKDRHGGFTVTADPEH